MDLFLFEIENLVKKLTKNLDSSYQTFRLGTSYFIQSCDSSSLQNVMCLNLYFMIFLLI